MTTNSVSSGHSQCWKLKVSSRPMGLQLFELLYRKKFAVYFVEVCTFDVKLVVLTSVRMKGSAKLCYMFMKILILASLQFGHSLQTLLLYRPQIGSDIEWRKSDSLIASLFERIFFVYQQQ